MKRIRNIVYNLNEDFVDFAEHTSAHGIPRAYVSEGLRRMLWLLLFLVCLCAFGYQAYLIIQRFQRNDIIVGVEIRFEEIRFPAVTICNINPYKNSLARQTSSIKSALESFESAIDRSAGKDHQPGQRRKRSIDVPPLRPAHVYCRRDHDHYVVDREGNERCLCSSFPNEEYYWNCAPESEFQIRVCPNDTVSLTPPLCYCRNHSYCIEVEQQVKIIGRWPLTLTMSDCANSSKTCLCVLPHVDDATEISPSYCSDISEWEYTMCNGCDWWGRCTQSFGLSGEEECICDGNSHRRCFAVETATEGLDEKGGDAEEKTLVRVRRKKIRVYEKILRQYEGILAVYSECSCKSDMYCDAIKEKQDTNTSNDCICFYNKKNDHLWPCYLQKDWQERKCPRCGTFGDCLYTDRQYGAHDCFCALPIRMCVQIDPPEGNLTDITDRIATYWDIAPPTTMSPLQYESERKKLDREKAYGYTGVKDPIALKGKAMENIIFAVDELTEQEKWAISYKKSELILKCSFNGQECKVDEEFNAFLDPTFGACFTYVGRHSAANITNERAGPAYGLRLEVFVNISEYLPTTEAAGVRLTVHTIEEQPFPDSLGHSAPTGFVSSFGIKLKTMTRLPAPYGDCIQEGKDEDYIYVTKQYSTEGCQRSCIQKHLATTCGCGDPRYPPFRKTKNCPVDDPIKRECLKQEMQYAVRYPKTIGCKCRQPCSQDVYSVSYSASRWPAVPGDLSGCPEGMAPHHCLSYKREQGAMVEVYYEELNYESLLESEAYGLPNLLSDFGGQLGLWMGVSVITIMEVCILILDVILTIFGLTGHRRKNFSSRNSMSSSARRFEKKSQGLLS
uniref:Degenerin unc-8 n=1 Tax=Haemonchus contortus TaxID=6289 RepID=A0A7I4Y020_HAECO|nr:Na+ channel domain containing protein [Haemonchus contortus]